MINNLANNPNKLLLVFLTILAIIALGALSLASNFAATFILICVCLLIIFIIFPPLGLYLTILALPLINWNFYIKDLIIPAVDVIAAISLTAFIIRTVYDKLFGQKQTIKLPFVRLFSLFFLATLLSSFFGEDIGASLWYAIRWVLFFYLAYIVVPVNIIKDGKHLRRSIICLIISAVLVGAMGVASLFFQDWQNNFVRIQPISLFNIYPIGDNQNLIAEFLVIVVMSAWALVYWRAVFPTRKRLLKLLTIFLALIAIATFSRAAWGALAVQGIVYFFYQTKEARRKYIVPIFVSLLVLLPLGFYMLKIQNEFSIGVSSTENRYLMSNIAFKAWSDSPVFGQGSGTFYNLIEENIRFRAQYGEPLDSHGVWQKVLAENGLLGVLTFAAFVGAIFLFLQRAIKAARGKREFQLILFLSLGALGGFVFQFFNTSYYKGKVWLPIALALAAVYLTQKQTKKLTDHEKLAKN